MATVLAVTSRNDDSTFLPLQAALATRGAELVRFDTEFYPQEAGLNTRLDQAQWTGSLHLPNGRRLDLDAIDAVWLRRLRPAQTLPRRELGASAFRACYREAVAHLTGVFSTLQCPVIDPPLTAERSECKPFQLVMARRAGLVTPETLITTEGPPVRRFAAAQGPLITKLMDGWVVEQGDTKGTVPTSAVGPDDLAHLDGLRLAPGAFQPQLPKALEARVLVLGDRLLAAAVDSQVDDRGAVDWRQNGDLLDAFFTIEPPKEVGDALLRYARSIGLRYGAADFILTPDGQWVFLELNACGEWGWLQEAGLPVADTLADLLLELARTPCMS